MPIEPIKPQQSYGMVIVGAKGMTASTAISGLLLMAHGVVAESYAVTSSPLFPPLNLVKAEQWHLAGWDLQDRDLADVIRSHDILGDLTEIAAELAETNFDCWPGLHTPFDIAREHGMSSLCEVEKLSEGASEVAQQLKSFQAEHGLTRTVVIYLGSPNRAAPKVSWDGDVIPDVAAPAGLMYAVGSALSGADFVDFTPSDTLDCESLWQLARRLGSRLSGRDGSTGQTMLKSAVLELLIRRNLVPQSWYSTNLIGNHDGYVLSHPEHNATKIADKLAATAPIAPVQEVEHRVNIEYLERWGDRKESWDAASFDTWLERDTLELRVSWRSGDSLLAAPMVLDLARLMTHPSNPTGFQYQLGYFFKRPYGRESQHLSWRWNELVKHYAPSTPAPLLGQE